MYRNAGSVREPARAAGPPANAVATLGATKKGAGVAVERAAQEQGGESLRGESRAAGPRPAGRGPGRLTLALTFHPADAGGGCSSGQPPGPRAGRAGLGEQRAAPASSSGSNGQRRAGFSLVLMSPEEEIPGRRQTPGNSLAFCLSNHFILRSPLPLQLSCPTPLPARENRPWVQVAHPAPLLGLTSVSPRRTPVRRGSGEPGKRPLRQALT